MVDTTSLVAEVKTKGVTKATKELDRFGKEATEAEKDTKSFQDSASKAFGALKVGAVAVAGAATALTALSIKVANAQKEWQTLSNIAGDSVDNFKATAFAAEQVGISAEKLADISKDTREKLGEFIATGGGGFKDFFEQVAPQIGITAQELQNLSGTQVLQKVTAAMEAANIPMEQQSFYLESIASDTTNLIPLLANESAELNRLADSYNRVNDSLSLSASQQGGIRQVAESFNLLGDTASNALSFIVGSFAPEFESAISGASEVVSDLANTFVFFFKSLQDGTEENLLIKIKDNLEEIAEEQENVYSSKKLEEARDRRVKWLEEENQKYLNQIKLIREVEKEENKRAEASTFLSTPLTSGPQLTGTTVSDNDEAKRAQELYDYRLELAREFNRQQDELNLEYINGLDERSQAELANQQMILVASSNLFGSLAQLQQTFGENQGSTYKALFALSKGFAIANSIVNLNSAITQAAADPTALTPAQKFANVAAVTGALTGVVSSIASASYNPSAGNFANGGIVGGSSFAGDNITANVNSGEMILNKGQQKNLFDLANGGGSSNVTVINNAPNSVARTEQLSSGEVKVIVEETLNSAVLSPNSQFNKNLDRTRKVQRQL